MFLTWLTQNIGTLIVSAVLLVLIIRIVAGLIRDKKQGKTSCGCDCGHCGASCRCHKTE